MFREPKNVWRIHLRPEKTDNSKYCIENGVVAIGWGFFKLEEENPNLYKSVKGITEWADYVYYNKKYYERDEVKSTVLRFRYDIVPGDVIWTHAEDGNYYFAVVNENSDWRFCSEHKARKKNASNQRINIHWHEVEDVSSIQDDLRKVFRGQTLQRVLNYPKVIEFTLEQLRRLENENS